MRLPFNCLEFEVIELRIVEMLPQAQETDGIPRPHPVLDNISRILVRTVLGYIRQRNEISGGVAIAHLHLQVVCLYVDSCEVLLEGIPSSDTCDAVLRGLPVAQKKTGL